MTGKSNGLRPTSMVMKPMKGTRRKSYIGQETIGGPISPDTRVALFVVQGKMLCAI
jgi:hypothetical protein